MKKMYNTANSIVIEQNKKTLFGEKIVVKEIELNDIVSFQIEKMYNELNSICIIKQNNNEEFFTIEEFSNLNDIVRFLIDERNKGKKYEILEFDIETCESRQI